MRRSAAWARRPLVRGMIPWFASGMKFPAVVVGVLAFAVSLMAAAPSVSKVEPPNWWVGHSLNPIRLLVHGRNLAGAKLGGARGRKVEAGTGKAAGT